MYKIVLICDKRNKEYTLNLANGANQVIIPTVPFGWIQTSDGYICDEHTITITDKEKENNE